MYHWECLLIDALARSSTYHNLQCVLCEVPYFTDEMTDRLFWQSDAYQQRPQQEENDAESVSSSGSSTSSFSSTDSVIDIGKLFLYRKEFRKAYTRIQKKKKKLRPLVKEAQQILQQEFEMYDNQTRTLLQVVRGAQRDAKRSIQRNPQYINARRKWTGLDAQITKLARKWRIAPTFRLHHHMNVKFTNELFYQSLHNKFDFTL